MVRGSRVDQFNETTGAFINTFVHNSAVAWRTPSTVNIAPSGDST